MTVPLIVVRDNYLNLKIYTIEEYFKFSISWKDALLLGLLLFTVVPCIGQLEWTLTGVFFLIGWIIMLQFVYEYDKYLTRNPGSFNRDHLIVIISSLWIRPPMQVPQKGMRGPGEWYHSLKTTFSFSSRSSLFWCKHYVYLCLLSPPPPVFHEKTFWLICILGFLPLFEKKFHNMLYVETTVKWKIVFP